MLILLRCVLEFVGMMSSAISAIKFVFDRFPARPECWDLELERFRWMDVGWTRFSALNRMSDGSSQHSERPLSVVVLKRKFLIQIITGRDRPKQLKETCGNRMCDPEVSEPGHHRSGPSKTAKGNVRRCGQNDVFSCCL